MFFWSLVPFLEHSSSRTRGAALAWASTTHITPLLIIPLCVVPTSKVVDNILCVRTATMFRGCSLLLHNMREKSFLVQALVRSTRKTEADRKAEALFAYLQDTYDGEGSLTNLEASTISVAIATENLSRNWRTMINNIQIKRPDFEIRAETLAEVLGQLETYFEAFKTS